MKILSKNKFLFWNLMALVFVKVLFSYSGLQFASLLDGVAVFSKEDVVSQTNVFRKALGLVELKESGVLDLAATQKLEDMRYNDYFAHTSPAGVSPWHWIEVNQYKYTYAGENLAIGFFTAKDTVEAWANSPSHRANLTNSNYKEIGVAIAPAKIQNTEGFLVVQLFGTPRPTVAAAKPLKTPSPSIKPLATIKASLPTPVALAATRLKPASTQIAPLPIGSSSESDKEISEPIASNVNQASPRLSILSKALNTTLILYSLLAFFVSVIMLVFRELKKELVVRTAASLALLVLAIIVPVLEISRTALIL